MMSGVFPRLAVDPLRASVEAAVSAHTGRQWVVKQAQDLADFASHPAAILSDGSYAVFAKFSDAPNGPDQFEIELAGLRLLSEQAGVLTPTPVGIFPAPGGSLLITEAVQAVERGVRQWRQIGQTLARIHQMKGDQFGFTTNGYFGPLPQDNTPLMDWPTFYAERRLEPGLKMAVDSGHLPPELISQVERVISRLPEFCGPVTLPTLLHGDAQRNNFISGELGTYVIDPAVYYGHPEMDLAYIDFFQPVPQDVYAGYQEEFPIDPGFWERRSLWRVWVYLAMIAVEGDSYIGMLAEALQEYV